MQLTGTRAFQNGMVELRYEIRHRPREGPIAFAATVRSRAEDARLQGEPRDHDQDPWPACTRKERVVRSGLSASELD